MRTVILLAAALASAAPLIAQDQPYATLTGRSIKALSAEVALGRQIVDGEAALDPAFRSTRISTDDLLVVEELGRIEGRLRLTHLHAHLQMMTVLTPDQVRRYQHLRGYAAGHDDPAHRH